MLAPVLRMSGYRTPPEHQAPVFKAKDYDSGASRCAHLKSIVRCFTHWLKTLPEV